MRFCLLLFFVLLLQWNFGQYQDSIQHLRDSFSLEILSEQSDVLNSEEKNNIQSFDWFSINKDYRVKAKFKVKKGKKFEIPTSSGRTKLYQSRGYVVFELHQQKVKLYVYQDVKLSQQEAYKDYLLLPFKDLTNGKETYGAGRYLDLKMPEKSTVILDFNLAYNPYCAYSHRYNCPIPPKENHLQISIQAGEKNPIEK
ncbi:MAG TPA: DUF1684 domain-containing protein [Taishania sp.]|nr:DUF1684 domain-containing protein [Taishania sp.]